MAIYDTGTASLAASGQVTGVGTQWTMPLTLIRVGATIIFKTNPLKIYTISEITSDTSMAVYNPNGETVPTGTGYAILAHDGISVQGLAQDVAETLRYYQSKETSIQSLIDFIGQDSFDWPRFEQLANQSVTGAADALASQIAAAESAATAVSARNTTTAARDATIDAINSAGDASTLVTLAGWGIGNDSNTLSELDFQTFNFIVGGNYVVSFAACTNVPEELIMPSNATLFISVEGGLTGDASRSMQVSTYTTDNNNFRRYNVSYVTSGSVRNYNVRESIYLPGGSEAGGANATRVRGLLDVYSKGDVDQKNENILNGLSSVNGFNMVGGATYEQLRQNSSDYDEIFVVGRDSKSIGSSGWFDKVSNQNLTDDDGIVIVSSNGDVWVRREKNEVNVLWFGADETGSIDSSVAINKAISAAATTNNGRVGLPPVLRIPAGTYNINGMIRFFDWANGSIFIDGAYFSGTSNLELDSVFQIDNASNLKINGSFTVTTNGLANYKSAFDIKASPGGTIKPDTGIVSHVDIFGLTVRESLTGISVGRYDNDAQVAEINFIGCETIFCAVAVAISGSQSAASFNGCTIASGMWPTFPASTVYRTLLMRGGICEINGGEFLNSGVTKDSNVSGIEMQPSLSSMYNNSYGALRITGSLIELNSGLLIIGPGLISDTRKSDFSFCTISSCGGYVDQGAGGDFISIFDDTYAGTVTVDQACNFYAIQGTRSGRNVYSKSAIARLNIGSTAFGTGFSDWIGGCVGGILIHELIPVAESQLTTKSFAASTEGVIVCTNPSGTYGKSRYGVYSNTNGRITIPNGCRSLVINYSGFTSSRSSGDFYIKMNNSQTVAFGNFNNGFMTINHSISGPTSGDYYELIIVPSVEISGFDFSKISISMSFQ